MVRAGVYTTLGNAQRKSFSVGKKIAIHRLVISVFVIFLGSLAALLGPLWVLFGNFLGALRARDPTDFTSPIGLYRALFTSD